MVTKTAAKSTAKKSAGKASPTKNRAGKTAGKSGQKFKVGDHVRWDSSGGTSAGRVVKVATSPGKIKDFEFKATKDDPRYIVETDEGKHAAHKAGELRKA